jgi:hypothetical protein
MKVKSDGGTMLTQALFYEFNNKDAPFTLRTEDFTSRAGITYPSAYLIYMDSVDEYAAIKNLGLTKTHWDKLCGLKWFMDGVQLNPDYQLAGLNKWREDMRDRDSSKAKRALLEAIDNGDTSAAKFLYTETTKSTKAAGRPEKKTPVRSTSTAVTQLKKIQQGL